MTRPYRSCAPLHEMDSDPRDEFVPVTDFLRSEDYDEARRQLVEEAAEWGGTDEDITEAMVERRAIANYTGEA